jgi:hypothetical protein
MSNQDKLLFEKLTLGIQLAVKKALDRIKDSSNPIIAVSKDGKTIEYINLKEQSTK